MSLKKLTLVEDSHICPCKTVSPSNTFNISSKLSSTLSFSACLSPFACAMLMNVVHGQLHVTNNATYC